MRDKYVKERFPAYFEFGKHKDGKVDIATEKDDTLATVSKEHAEKLIQDRFDVVEMLCKLAREFDRVAPKEFGKLWYDTNPTD